MNKAFFVSMIIHIYAFPVVELQLVILQIKKKTMKIFVKKHKKDHLLLFLERSAANCLITSWTSLSELQSMCEST